MSLTTKLLLGLAVVGGVILLVKRASAGTNYLPSPGDISGINALGFANPNTTTGPRIAARTGAAHF